MNYKISVHNSTVTPKIGATLETVDLIDGIKSMLYYENRYCRSYYSTDYDETQLKFIKASTPKIFPFISSDNTFYSSDVTTYTSDGVVFLDFDLKDVADYYFDEKYFDTINKQCNWIIAAWRSFSGKLHIAALDNSLKDLTGDELNEAYKKSYFCYTWVFYIQLFYITDGLFNPENYMNTETDKNHLFDKSGRNIYQGFFTNYITESEYYINRYPSNYCFDYDSVLTNVAESFNVDLTSIAFESKKKTTDKKKSNIVIGDFCAKVDSDKKITIDKNFTAVFYNKKYSGYMLRFQFAISLYKMFGDNAKEISNQIFSRQTAIEINSAINTISNNKSQKYESNIDVETYIAYNLVDRFASDEVIELSDNEYVSKYYAKIIGLLRKQNVYLKAGCGVGKSSLYRTMCKTEDRVLIVCHLKSIRDGVYNKSQFAKNALFGDEFVDLTEVATVMSTTEVNKMIKENKKLPNKLVVNWESFQILCENMRYNNELVEYYKCFDEAHNIISSYNYRSKVIANIMKDNAFKHTIFCSGTPLGEQNLIDDCYKIEIKKNINRTVSIKYMCWDPEIQSISNIRYFDTVIEYVNDNIDNYDKIAIFDNHKHREFAEHYGDYAMHFCRENKDEEETVDSKYIKEDGILELFKSNQLKQKLFITTTYGTQGIEIKNNIDKLLVIIPMRSVSVAEVEQVYNRFRNAKNIDVVLVQTEYVCHAYNSDYFDYLYYIMQNKKDKSELLKENINISNFCLVNNGKFDNVYQIENIIKLANTYHYNQKLNVLNEHNVYSIYTGKAQLLVNRYYEFDRYEKIVSPHKKEIDDVLVKYPFLFENHGRYMSKYDIKQILENLNFGSNSGDVKYIENMNRQWVRLYDMCKDFTIVLRDNNVATKMVYNEEAPANKELVDLIKEIWFVQGKQNINNAIHFLSDYVDYCKYLILGTSFIKYGELKQKDKTFSVLNSKANMWNLNLMNITVSDIVSVIVLTR